MIGQVIGYKKTTLIKEFPICSECNILFLLGVKTFKRTHATQRWMCCVSTLSLIVTHHLELIHRLCFMYYSMLCTSQFYSFGITKPKESCLYSSLMFSIQPGNSWLLKPIVTALRPSASPSSSVLLRSYHYHFSRFLQNSAAHIRSFWKDELWQIWEEKK